MATKKTVAKSKSTKTKAAKPKAVRAVSGKKRTSSNAATRRQSRFVGLTRDEEAFMTFRVNRETFYWLVLGIVVIAFTAWIMHLQNEIQAIYDQIDTNTMMEPEPVVQRE